jgi:hypothetical protein
MTDTDLITALETAAARLDDALWGLDLATARYGHGLARCRRLARDAQALLEEATDGDA